MQLPTVPTRYVSPEWARAAVQALEEADRENLKRGVDLELVDEALILRSPDGSRWALTVDNSGVLGTTAL